ncbi:MAG: hypothetical protein WBP23_02210 [Candidatus Saccharimonadales bacterium]
MQKRTTDYQDAEAVAEVSRFLLSGKRGSRSAERDRHVFLKKIALVGWQSENCHVK